MSSLLKLHCPSCGGYLSIDNDKQMYHCTFCGSTYDYEYFREDRMHELGETYLSRGEFKAAIEAYEFILEKDPHDFLALRGLMLASARLTDMNKLEQLNDKKGFLYDSKLAGKAIESASEEDKEYFTMFGRVYSAKKELVDRARELENQKKEHFRIEAAIRLTEDTRYDYYIKSKSGSTPPKAMFILVWIFTVIGALHAILIAGVFGDGDPVGTVILAAIMAGVIVAAGAGYNFIKVYPNISVIKEIDGYISEFRYEENLAGIKVKDLEREVEDLAAGLRRSITDFLKKDSQITTDSVKEYVKKDSLAVAAPIKEYVTETRNVKKHQCPSCGGSLIIDNDKQMYHCTFCGQTYEYEYFREDQMHEAGENYISRSEFMAAADAYDFTLKKDPHDFLALRGMVLAAAHLSNMNELEQDVDGTEFPYDLQTVEDAIENAAEEDRQYFKDLAEVYSEKQRLAEYNREMHSLWEEKEKINSIIAGNNIKRNDYYLGAKQGAKESPKMELIIVSVITAFWSLMELFFIVEAVKASLSGNGDDRIFGSLAFMHGAICIGLLAYTFGYVYPKHKRLKRLDKENSKHYVESGNMDDRMRDLENETEKLKKEIKRSIHDFVKKDRLIMRDKMPNE